jgi:glycerate-2-kinase
VKAGATYLRRAFSAGKATHKMLRAIQAQIAGAGAAVVVDPDGPRTDHLSALLTHDHVSGQH